jgi:hypothetical protein
MDVQDHSRLAPLAVPGIPGLKVLTEVPKVGKGLQTSSAPGEVSHGGALYFADTL